MSAYNPSGRVGTFEGPKSPGHVGLALDGLETVLEPVARAVDRNHLAVVEEPVEVAGGEDLVAEELAPLGDADVGGQDRIVLDFRCDTTACPPTPP